MTYNEIIQTMRYFASQKVVVNQHTGQVLIMQDILDIIDRQKEESDYLKRDVLPRYKDALRRANKIGTSLDKKNQELRAEIERLTDMIHRQSDVVEEQRDMLDEIKTARSGVIKEFAEMVCEGRVANDPVVIAVRYAVKEMTEGKDAGKDI